MFGRFMNNYFYGKSGKGDYTREDLPETRTQLFWETLRTRFSGLMRLNLLYMLSWIPALLVIGYHVLLLYSATVNLADLQSQVDDGHPGRRGLRDPAGDVRGRGEGRGASALLFLIPRWR
jgi:hypothetical protein